MCVLECAYNENDYLCTFVQILHAALLPVPDFWG